MNLIEKALAAVSPSLALSRARDRIALDMITARYDAATAGPRAPRGRNVRTDANGAAVKRQTIAFVARDLARNSPFGVRVPQVITNNVVGDGIIPKVTGFKAKSEQTKRARVMDVLRAHFDTVACDADGRCNLYGLQRLAMEALVVSGEVLIRRRRRNLTDGLPVPFQMQVMESDYLSSDNDGDLAGGGYVLNGIEFNAIGKRVAYYLYDRHPGDTSRLGGMKTTVRRVEASEILHLMRVDRPGQIRGVSWLAPVVMVMNDLADYMDAQLMRQKIAALFAAFIKAGDGGGAITQTQLTQEFTDMAPARIQRLGLDEDVTFSNPPAVDGLEPMLRAYLRATAVGTGITYEALSGDLSQVNFASGRMGRMEMNANISAWQWLLMIPQMMLPLGEWFLQAYQMVYPNDVLPKSTAIAWVPPRIQMVDPAREIPMLIAKIRAGLSSWQGTVRELGYDPEDLIAEIGADNAQFDLLKMIFDSDARRTSGAGQGQNMINAMTNTDGAADNGGKNGQK